MANNVSSTNLTGLYGSNGNTVLVAVSNVPVVNNSVSSKNLTTLYSGSPTIVPSNSGGGGNGTANITILDEGNVITSNVASMNFTGGAVVATAIGNAVTINISGGNANFAANANYANFAGNAFSVNVANVVGIGNIAVLNLDGNASNILYGNGVFATVPNTAVANFANYAGNVTVSAQPNITSVGTLVNLSVSGNVTSGNANLGNLAIANFFSGNGSLLTGVISTGGNSNFANFAGNVTNSAQPNITSVGTLVNLSVSGNITSGNANLGNLVIANYFSGSGNNLSNIQGSNVTGNVTSAITANFANYAGNVTNAAQPNITSVGTLVSLDVTGNISSGNANLGNLVVANFFSGDGSLLSNINGSNVSNVANANYANFAGNVTNSAQPNITSVGTLVNLSVSGNIISGNANLGNLVIANYFSGSGNNLSNIQGSNVTGNVTSAITANFANYAGNVTNSAQPNITSVGTLVNLDVTGNITSGNANLGNLVVANFFSGDGSLLSNINGANVSNVANANFAAYAGNVTNAAQPNITSVGTLVSLDVTGNISSGNANLGNLVVANFFSGDGSLLSNINGANVSNVANANFAAYAGNVTVNAQPNITSLGNLPYLQVSNSANAIGVINQLSSGNITFASNFTNVATYQLTTLFHPNNSTAYPNDKVVRSRGNVTTPTTAASGDRIYQKAGFVYNGATNAFSVAETFTAVSINANANAAWSGGQWNILTGNPAGEVGNSSATSPQNSLAFNNSGGLFIVPGTAPNSSLGQSTSSINITNYGRDTTNLVQVGGLNFQRARGNRDSVSNVAAGDQVGRSVFIAYSNGAYQSSNVAQYNVTVDSTYVGNDLIVPMSHFFQTVANVANVATFRNFRFYANGTTALPGNINFTTSTANLFTGSGGQVALGIGAGNTSQGNSSLALGEGAAFNTQGTQSVALGYYAGANTQGQYSVAIGRQAGEFSQGSNSFALGYGAGQNFQGNNSVALGYAAGYTNQANNSIILNATGSILDQTTANTFTVKPVRNVGTANLMFYNNSSGEITYDLASNTTVGNANYANFAGNALVLANGTSNISIPVANGNVNISTNGNANIAQFDTNGALFLYPTTSSLNALRITSFGNPSSGDVSRIASSRARGNITTPLSVQGSDRLMRLLTFGHNGTAYQTNSIGAFQAQVDASYTANGANIPIGWLMTVNDTNGGVNNQSKNHQFYSNGTVSFANSISVSGNGNISGTNLVVNTGTVTNTLIVGTGVSSSGVFITGDKTINSTFRIVGSPFTSIMDNVNPTTGYSPFFFNTYENANTFIPPSRYFRARGTEASPAAVTTNDVVQLSSYAVYADSGNTYKDVINTGVYVTGNDGLGNVTGDFYIQGFNANSNTRIMTNNTYANIFTANYLKGDGSNISNIAGANITGQVANALVAGTVYTNAQPNITSVGTLTSLSVSGNITSGNANLGNLATANYFTGTLTTNAQPNITSVGTLTSLSVSGNITSGNANLGNLVTANYFSGNLVGNTSIANLTLTNFQETVYNGGNATGTITPDFNNGSIQKFTLTGNITMNTLGNAIAGRSMTLIFTQDGTGNRLLTSSMYFAGGLTTLSSSAGARDIISVFYDGTDYYASLTTGYA